MRHMLAYALGQARPVRDDQQILVRYAHEHPHLVAVDVQVYNNNIIIFIVIITTHPLLSSRSPPMILYSLLYCYVFF